jgi:hypothetical protein
LPVLPVRNAPVVTCLLCGCTLLPDVMVVRVHAAKGVPEILQSIGYVYAAFARRRAAVCEPCWDAATPIPWEAHWGAPHIQRRSGEWLLDISSGGRHPDVQAAPCEHCGRRVLCDVSRRQLISCSERCRIYTSQARWPREPRPKQEQRPDMRCRRRGCGRVFTPRTRDQWYCSGACRQAAYRQRNADQKPQQTSAGKEPGRKGEHDE